MGYGQVERIKCSFVLYNQRPSICRQLFKCAVGTDRVQELPNLSLECCFQKKLNEPRIARILTKVSLEHFVYKHFHHQEVVCVQQANVGEPSIMSSAMSMHAWRNSTAQPSIANRQRSLF